MNDIKIKDILRVCSGKLLIGNEDLVCESFSKDTRTIKNGDIYIGIKGKNFDGNLFYQDALDKGASACILQSTELSNLDKEKYADKTIVVVKDTIVALQQLARYKRNLYNILVVAITGSVGKTSTKDIVANVLAQKYNVLKTPGNLNNNIGLPLTILSLRNHNALVVEMGMSSFGEISVLTNIAYPTTCVITNIGTSHIGCLGSRENILKAKLEILEGLKEEGSLVINNDNDLLHDWYSNYKSNINIETFGIENKSNIMPKNIKLLENKSEYKIDIDDKEYDIVVPVSGVHFVYNSLCAITVGLINNIDIKDIIRGIEEFKLTKNRMDILKNNKNVTIINDSYNASYESMKASLEYISLIESPRKIAVLGDMLELGEFSKELHEKVGEEVYKNKLDILVAVGKEAKNIAYKCIELGMQEENIKVFSSNDEAVEFLNKILKSEDVVLIKASYSMNFINIVNAIK